MLDALAVPVEQITDRAAQNWYHQKTVLGYVSLSCAFCILKYIICVSVCAQETAEGITVALIPLPETACSRVELHC